MYRFGVIGMKDKNEKLNIVVTPEEAAVESEAIDTAVETTATVDAQTVENDSASVAVDTENAEQLNAETEVSPDTEEVETPQKEAALPPKKKKGLRAWWERHKPSKRRWIQIYSMLLYNAYLRGFIKGDIFKGITKTACVPGLNCYSCPGAVGACPLGSLQNALTGTGHGGAYYVIGIILLYGLIFGRTICGFLCPMGFGQDLLYKIRTPKLKKSKVTRILSYLKYVILIVLVVGIPIIYSIDQKAVPGFCKYICPAGTLEGAIMLLIHPSNDYLYGMLGALFSWKTVVLVSVFTASIFIYRFFCRFLCPLGALYGLFNRFALLGIKVNRDKCTNCGKCVEKCKMDIKNVGDHECINCGECIGVCPTKAITWKGSKIFMKNVDESLIKATPTIAEVDTAETTATVNVDAAQATETAVVGGGTGTGSPIYNNEKQAATKPIKKKRDRTFWAKIVAVVLAVMLYAGVFTYVNFFAVADETVTAEYMFVVDDVDGREGLLSFSIGKSDKPANMSGGEGTEAKPIKVKSITGAWDVPTGSGATYFKYKTSKAGTYTVSCSDYVKDRLSLKIYYMMAGRAYSVYDNRANGDSFTLTLKAPDGYGNEVGDVCYDFELDCYNGRDKVRLSDLCGENAENGKVVVVNFWGVWCGPCVDELPDFEEVRSGRDDVEIIAIHSVYGSNGSSVQTFLNSKKWSEWGIIFAQDTGTVALSDTYARLGGKSTYPRTLVIDKNGVISAVKDGPISKEALTAAIDAAAVVESEE